MSSSATPLRSNPTTAYRRYVLAVLTAVYAFNIADRYVISTLIEPIKADLALSDTSIGFLTGTALAIVYTGMGLPLAAIADRGNRRNLLVLAIAIWSVMTSVSGMASSFTLLLLARIGVGLGEAGATPASQSMLADLFGFEQRLLAASVFAVGAALGSTMGTSLGGTLSNAFGWRTAFVALGVMSAVLAPAVLLSVREPERAGDTLDPRSRREHARHLLSFAASQRSLLHTLAGGTVCTLWCWGLMWWTPAFLARSYGMTTGEAGRLLGVINAIGGTLGAVLGGWALQSFGRRDPRVQCWVLAGVVAVATIASVLAYATHNRSMMLAMLWLYIPVAYFYLSPVFGWIQSLTPARLRATACAVFLFGSNLANLAIAPQLVGCLTDQLAAHLGTGAGSLRLVLIGLAFTGLWAALHFWAAAASFLQDLRRVNADLPAEAAPRNVLQSPNSGGAGYVG